MKKYHITRTANGVCLTAQEGDAGQSVRTINANTSQAIYNHSPDGFEFGYGGSGPLQLALAILLDHCGPDPAKLHYHEFTTEFISPLRGRNHTIDVAVMDVWLRNKEGRNAS